MPTYTITFEPDAQDDLNALDTTTRDLINRALARLASNPTAGKPLKHDLTGLFSVPAASRRFRIVYEIDTATTTVTVLVIAARQGGKRSDPYATARRRV